VILIASPLVLAEGNGAHWTDGGSPDCRFTMTCSLFPLVAEVSAWIGVLVSSVPGKHICWRHGKS
jgi:hypothetical protein